MGRREPNRAKVHTPATPAGDKSYNELAAESQALEDGAGASLRSFGFGSFRSFGRLGSFRGFRFRSHFGSDLAAFVATLAGIVTLATTAAVNRTVATTVATAVAATMAAVATAMLAEQTTVATLAAMATEQTAVATIATAAVAPATTATAATTVTVAAATAMAAVARDGLVVAAQQRQSDDRKEHCDPECNKSIHVYLPKTFFWIRKN